MQLQYKVMRKKIRLFLLFLATNFGALGLGVLLMNNGSTSEWYYSLDKAPWSPEGWVFGAAWFSLMFFYSIYMANLVLHYEIPNTKLIVLYAMQWSLNVSWNYIFFNQHMTVLGLIVIVSLWLLVGYFAFNFLKKLKYRTLFIAPYLIWMTIAMSLNLYIVIHN